MSASSASPKLKRAARKSAKIQKTQEVSRRLPMSAGKVNLLSKYFENGDKPDQKMIMKYRQHNNNKLSVKNVLGPKNNTEIAVCGAAPCPEMTFQSGNSANQWEDNLLVR